MDASSESAPNQPSKLITCILPDDGCHRELLEALHHEKKIPQAAVLSCLGMSSLADANIKPGTLPDTFMARLVTVVVPESEADVLFDYIYEKARVGRDGGGAVLQSELATSTPYSLPEDVADEWDAETVQYPGQRLPARRLNAVENPLRRLLGHALEIDELFQRQRVQIRDVFRQPLVHQLLHQHVSHAVDIHYAAGSEMAD